MARAADSRARIRVAISVAIGQEPVIVHPPFIMPDSNASQPSVVLWAKTTDPMPSSCSTRRPSANARAIVTSNHARSFGLPPSSLVSSCTASCRFGVSGFSESKGSRNSACSRITRFSQT